MISLRGDVQSVDNPTMEHIVDCLNQLDGENHSVIFLEHADSTLMVLGTQKGRCRLEYVIKQPIHHYHLRENTLVDQNEWLFFRWHGGEYEGVPYHETVPLELAIDVCQYFKQHETVPPKLAWHDQLADLNLLQPEVAIHHP